MTKGRAALEAGGFFAAHEAFEDGWRVTRGDERRVLQVLVLWAAALHQHENGRGGGARRLLARALERLNGVSEAFGAIDVDGLKGAVLDTWGQLLSGDAVKPVWPEDLPHRPAALVLEHTASCPYCGEPVLVSLAPEDADGAQYVEDCPVCCRAWSVNVRSDGRTVDVAVNRLDS